MYKLLRPLLFRIDPETAHDRMTAWAAVFARTNLFRILSKIGQKHNPSLQNHMWGLDFKNPVGLAAGFDKNGKLANFMPILGFAFMELGTVTPLAQAGNEKPRLFRIPEDMAVINRMGFNNDGAAALAARLKNSTAKIPIGVNIGKNKATANEDAVSDYEKCFVAVADVADYIVVNVSSPNTPNLRELQEKDSLRKLLSKISEINRKRKRPIPLLLKIAPDLTDEALEDIAEISKEIGLDGIIATNTTSGRSGLTAPENLIKEIGAGGLSGAPIRKRSTEVIAVLHRKLGKKIPIIGVGGIFSAEDAYEKILAGASLVQVWSGLIYEGPGLVRKINKQLPRFLKRDGFKNITEAVGTGTKS